MSKFGYSSYGKGETLTKALYGFFGETDKTHLLQKIRKLEKEIEDLKEQIKSMKSSENTEFLNREYSERPIAE